MAYDMFLKIEGIAGESQDDAHAGEIDILKWQWGMRHPGNMHRGGGGGAGKVAISDLIFTHLVDKATGNLMLYCANGKPIPVACFVVRKAGETPLEYFKITMKKCIVTSVTSGGESGSDLLSESFTLNFAEVKVEYMEQAKDGSGTVGPEFSWNIAKNVAA